MACVGTWERTAELTKLPKGLLRVCVWFCREEVSVARLSKSRRVHKVIPIASIDRRGRRSKRLLSPGVHRQAGSIDDPVRGEAVCRSSTLASGEPQR